MNRHLNLFRFFNEIRENSSIENNLSRAFAICLMNNSFLLNEYIQQIVTKEDYQYLFRSIDEDTRRTIDIQVDTSIIEKESFRRVYAVAMTSNKNLLMDNFFQQQKTKNSKNITDIIITIKDVVLIIEIKLTEEDCKRQLYNQALGFIEKEGCEVIPKSISWQNTIEILEKVKNIQVLASQTPVFVADFLQLTEVEFSQWFNPKPFNVLPFSSQSGSPAYVQLCKRMKQVLSTAEYEVFDYNDRFGISVDFGWASEIIPEFQSYKDDEVKGYVVFYIWPGNTKEQGYEVFNKPLDWQNKTKFLIDKNEFDLEIVYHLKLCHFNKFITGMNFNNNDLTKPLYTQDNFYKKSGKWDRNRWDEFEDFMDDYFKSEFEWRSRCDWNNKFVNTDRGYFTMSLGYEVCVFIPYSHFKAIDKNEDNIIEVSSYINKIAEAFRFLIN